MITAQAVKTFIISIIANNSFLEVIATQIGSTWISHHFRIYKRSGGWGPSFSRSHGLISARQCKWYKNFRSTEPFIWVLHVLLYLCATVHFTVTVHYFSFCKGFLDDFRIMIIALQRLHPTQKEDFSEEKKSSFLTTGILFTSLYHLCLSFNHELKVSKKSLASKMLNIEQSLVTKNRAHCAKIFMNQIWVYRKGIPTGLPWVFTCVKI